MSIAVGFVAERLTQARVARALSAVDLAGMLGISKTSMSNYENAKQTPRQDVVQKLASVTGFPREFFFRPALEQEDSPVFWRAALTAQPAMLERAKVRLEWMKEMVDYLDEYFDYPQLDLPGIEVETNPLFISNDHVEGAANALRAHWGVRSGPLVSALSKVEASGILVARIHVSAEKVDAFSQWSLGRGMPFIVLSRDKASAVRQRFDLMHEMGHILLHRHISRTQLRHRPTYKMLESHANNFASAALLPEKDFLDELYAPTLDAMLSLKERWGVSVAAMIVRCRNLGLLDDEATKRIYINYNRRQWRKNEPFDEGSIPEQPLLVRQSIGMLLKEDVQSAEEIKKALPFPIDELEELADLEAGTLGLSEQTSGPVLKKRTASGNVVSLFGS